MRGVAQAEGDRVVVQPLKAVRVELQADLAPHVCSIDVLALPARQRPALPQDEVVSILHKQNLCDSSPPPRQLLKTDIGLLLALLMAVFQALCFPIRSHAHGLALLRKLLMDQGRSLQILTLATGKGSSYARTPER